MRIVISGATGFLGRSIIRAGSGNGDVITALVREPTRLTEPFPASVQVVPFRNAMSDDLVAAIDGADAIVNLAGEPVVGRWTELKKHAIVESRQRATQALVDAIDRASCRPSVFVSASAVGYYGAVDHEVDERSPAGDDFLAKTCSIWEQTAQRAAAFGVRVCRMRIGIVLGAGGALQKMATPFKLGLGGPIGDGKQWVPWIHIDDVVGLFRLALERSDADGPINVTAPEPVRNADFSRALGSALSRPSMISTPAFALRALFGEGAAPLLTGQRALPTRATELGYVFRWPTLAAALHDALALEA